MLLGFREPSGGTSDPGCSADAVAGCDRAGGFPQGDRWSGWPMPAGSGVGSFLRHGVRVPEPSSDGAEDLELRRTRILVVPEAVVAGTVSVVAGEQQLHLRSTGP